MATIIPLKIERKVAAPAIVQAPDSDKRVKITTELCRKDYPTRVKLYDLEIPGFYVSIAPTRIRKGVKVKGKVTFNLRYTDKTTGKQKSLTLGTFHEDLYPVKQARDEAMIGAGRAGQGTRLAEERRKETSERELIDITVAEAAAMYIAAISIPTRQDDGKIRPDVETWPRLERYLERFLLPRLGHVMVREVKRAQLAEIEREIYAGTYRDDKGKRTKAGSKSTRRHFRATVTRFFGWCMGAGLGDLQYSPADRMEKLKREKGRDRYLSEDEIRTLWHALDNRDDLPIQRQGALAIKFQLATMLRSWELLGAVRSEIKTVDGQKYLVVPPERVKKRRTIVQPLTPLALRLLEEAQALSSGDFIFGGSVPPDKQLMRTALRGRTESAHQKRKPGICEILGMEPSTPHDNRRTGATWAKEIGQATSKISLCLDHRPKEDNDGRKFSDVTLKHYVHAKAADLRDKWEVLTAWEAFLLKTVGEAK